MGVKYVVTNLIRLVWINLCERQDAKQAKYGRGINSMMPNGQSTDGGINKEYDMGDEIPTRIMRQEMDPNMKETIQIRLDIIYQTYIT